MPNISKVKLPTGGVYDIKDKDARDALEDLVAVHLAGPYDSVEDLPATGEKDLLYLVKSSTPSPGVLFDEYIWVDLGSESYEYQKVLFDLYVSENYDENMSLNITSLKSTDTLYWWYGSSDRWAEYSGEEPEIGLPITLQFTGHDLQSGDPQSVTVTKNLQYNSDEGYYFADLTDIFDNYPDPSDFPESWMVTPRLIIEQDQDGYYGGLQGIWCLGSDETCFYVDTWWIERIKSVEDVEISALYEQVGHDVSGEIQDLIEQFQQELNNVYSSIYSRVYKYGDTMYGNLTLNSTPTNDKHAVTKKYVDDAVGAVAGLSFAGPYNSFEDLPAQGDGSKIYLVSIPSSESNNIYEEYIYINNSYELIGTTEMDLSGYLQPSDLPTYITYTEYKPSISATDLTGRIGTLSINGNDNVLRSPIDIGIVHPHGVLYIPDDVVCTFENTKVKATEWFIFKTKNIITVTSIHKVRDTSQDANLLNSLTVPANKICIGRVQNFQLEYYVLSEELATKSQVDAKVDVHTESTTQGIIQHSDIITTSSGITLTRMASDLDNGQVLTTSSYGISITSSGIQAGNCIQGSAPGTGVINPLININSSDGVAIHSVATPTVSRDAATKQYVDDSISTAITNAINGGY